MVNRTVSRRIARDSGFTLIDMVAVIAVLAVVAGIAVPVMKSMTDGMHLGQSAREVEREIQTARLRAVTANRAIRIRFNCPGAGQYRMVELLGTPTNNHANDAAANRCQESVYPSTPADNNPLTLPNHDGPVRSIHSTVSFGATQPLEFWPDGTVHSDPTGASPPAGSSWPVVASSGTAITLTKGSLTKRITVNGLGKVQLQ